MSNRLRIVAETGAAHRKSYARCLALIHHARQVGADAVKFGAFKPQQMTAESSEPPFVISSGQWSGRSLYELYEQSALRYEWLPDLHRAAQAARLEFIVAVYHPETVALLPQWGARTVKISSFELRYHDLLEAVAKQPYVSKVILSTGSATEQEIAEALSILKDKDVTLLYCVSSYPAPPEAMNMATLQDLQKFGTKVGLSDHTTGIAASVMAVAMGACLIEKHLKLDNENLDAEFAIFPDRFNAMVEICRQAETMMGKVSYDRPKSYHRKNVGGKMLRVVW